MVNQCKICVYPAIKAYGNNLIIRNSPAKYTCCHRYCAFTVL